MYGSSGLVKFGKNSEIAARVASGLGNTSRRFRRVADNAFLNNQAGTSKAKAFYYGAKMYSARAGEQVFAQGAKYPRSFSGTAVGVGAAGAGLGAFKFFNGQNFQPTNRQN